MTDPTAAERRGDAEALSEASIEQWRQQVANRQVDPELPWTDRDVVALVARFLATLDAARADAADNLSRGDDGLLHCRGCDGHDQ